MSTPGTIRSFVSHQSLRRQQGGYRRVFWPVIVLLLLLLVWEIGVRLYDVPTYVLPPPTDIIEAAVYNLEPLGRHLQISFSAFAIAYTLTVVVGYLTALAMYQWKTLEVVLYPYVITARAIPIVALIPIFIIWFGFGLNSIIVISFLISFFAMVVNTLTGFKSTDDELSDMLHSFSASRWEIFRNVHVYSSLPAVFAGLKICVILTFTGVIVGEFLIGSEGIGYLIIEYNNNLATAKMFAAILTISITQLFLFYSIVVLEGWVVSWD